MTHIDPESTDLTKPVQGAETTDLRTTTERVVYGVLGGCVAVLAVVATICLCLAMLGRVGIS